MGRGRAKAKQTKVARELKYNTSGPDLERLRQELAGGSGTPVEDDDDTDDFDDPYADTYGDAEGGDRSA